VAVVRCPKCGAVNPEGQRRGARCRACHEALGKCRYCRHCDPQTLDCTYEGRREMDHLVDVDDVLLNCLDFSTRLTAAPAARRRPVVFLTALFLLIAASAASLAVLRIVRLSARTSPGLPLRMSVGVPDSALKEEGLDVSVTLSNLGENDLDGIEVQVAGKGMSALAFQSLVPQESYQNAKRGSVTAKIERLPAGELCELKFHFTANRTGRVPLLVSVTAAGTEGTKVQSVDAEIIP